jgi:undecaprenyl pyrophosphate synthase
MVCYLLMDESGDLGFDVTKKATSHYFLITFLFTDNKRAFEKCVKKTHALLSKKHKKVGILHASHNSPETRKRLLRMLSEKNIKVMTIYLDRKRVYTKMQNEKPILYNYVTNILLDRIFSKKIIESDSPVEIIASRKETNKFLNMNFKHYLESEMAHNHGVKVNVAIKTPSQDMDNKLLIS